MMCGLLLSACGGGASDTGDPGDPGVTPTTVPPTATATPLDQQLRARIDAVNLSANPASGVVVPDIDTALPQLGMRLFFSQSLGGDLDSACVSCHHPALGGADELSLSVGVAAIDPSLLGQGRAPVDGVVRVPRNAPSSFNVALMDRALFVDGRVESLTPTAGANGAGGAIRTPDSAFGTPDPNAGDTLTAAQARFPVTSTDEMRGALLPGADNDAVRVHLAQRIGNYGAGQGKLPVNQWLPLFQSAFNTAAPADQLVTDSNIATAIAAYERSQLFVDTPWSRYIGGDLTAISDPAKRGALLFFTRADEGGAGCGACHRGDLLSDQNFHTVAFPQIGPGKGDGPNGTDDFGRERESGNPADFYAYRTPSLLNVALTAPYGHDGAYATLSDVVRHYRNPNSEVRNYLDRERWCQLPQFADLPHDECAALYPDARVNSQAALAKLQADRDAGVLTIPNIQINDTQVAELVAFLESLTDDCAGDRRCVARWIPPRDGGPDHEQLDAVDEQGRPL
ncbi:cytochrome C peroxidase [Sinimarinibacterium sp. CAU 1509]|nr:cytochrome C peroxidase [Sinimarinibacterium sp. CAU 1509]